MDRLITHFTIIYLLILLVFTSCVSEKNKSDNDYTTYIEENHEYLRDMILCQCIYLTDSSYYKNESSIGFLFNRSNYGPEIFSKIDSIIFLYKPGFSSVVGHKLGIAECLNLYRSDSLKFALRKFDPLLVKQ